MSRSGRKIISTTSDERSSKTVVGMLRSLVTSFGGVLSGFLALVMVPLFVVYFVLDLDSIDTRLRRQLPADWADDAVAAGRPSSTVSSARTRAG